VQATQTLPDIDVLDVDSCPLSQTVQESDRPIRRLSKDHELFAINWMKSTRQFQAKMTVIELAQGARDGDLASGQPPSAAPRLICHESSI
jgi:hypothetical protein